MSKLQLLKNTVGRFAGRSGVMVKKFSPEILTGLGVVGIVGSTVLACKATLKVDKVLEKKEENIKKIKNAHETLDKSEYSDVDYKKDMTMTYVQTGVDLVKLYAPAVTLGIASIGCILGAHNIMRKRNVALVAAYKAVEEGFNKYRKRVIDEYGTEKDFQFKNGVHRVETGEVETVIDENGKKKKVKKTVDVVKPGDLSVYARFFDEMSSQWEKNAEYNLMFLRSQQNFANDLLRSRGHVFLNEVYDMLGIPRSSEGSVVGWVRGGGDDYIDFGIYDINRERVRDFVNGYERSILLDFNVDGLIYDKI